MARLISGVVKPVSLAVKDAGFARESGSALSRFVTRDSEQLTLQVRDDRTGGEIRTVVPAAAIRLLAEVLSEMAAGHSVTVVPLNSEVSTQQGADLLGVSRPFFIKLLEQGKMPYRKVGEQRRVRYKDLLDYVETYQREATAALDEMAAEARRMGLHG